MITHCNSTWSISEDDLRTIGPHVTEQDSLDDEREKEIAVSVTDPMDLYLGKDRSVNDSVEEDVKLRGSFAALQNNSGTLRVYDYRETSGDGKVISSFSKGSDSKKGRGS